MWWGPFDGVGGDAPPIEAESGVAGSAQFRSRVSLPQLGPVDPFRYDTFLVAAVDDVEHRSAELVEPFEFRDMRNVAPSEAPSPEPDATPAYVWALNAADLAVGSEPAAVGLGPAAGPAPVGVLFPSSAGLVLTSALRNTAPLPWLSAYTIGKTVVHPSGCPTYKLIRGSGSSNAYFADDEEGARQIGWALGRDDARTEAGEILNGYTCPNAACAEKRVINMNIDVWASAHVTYLGSFLWGRTRYYGAYYYEWQAIIECSIP
ncbi:MAG: hypothetical protein AAF467_22370 [Actinomycetota bacterium]